MQGFSNIQSGIPLTQTISSGSSIEINSSENVTTTGASPGTISTTLNVVSPNIATGAVPTNGSVDQLSNGVGQLGTQWGNVLRGTQVGTLLQKALKALRKP